MEEVMPQISINELTIHYNDNHHTGQCVVLLHGWGQSKEMMEPIEQQLSNDFRVINLDLPGFGASDLPLKPWGVYEYTDFLKVFLDAINVDDPILIAHSFGARLAIIFASQNTTRKLILTGAAGIKPKRSLGYHMRVRTYKMAKVVFMIPGLNKHQESMRRFFGSSDYRAISGVMRQSFVKIVNEDLTPLLSQITCPTLLIWGEKDDATPLWMGKLMEKKIPDAGLVIFEDDDHYAYWNQMARFNKICNVFLTDDMEDTQ
jgi:pimeloyl-ACP methyl ester carboxylesterase